MKKILPFLLLAGALMFEGCKTEGPPKNYDTLFLGLNFGMQRKAFFQHCWNLNKQKVITHGPNNVVEYRLRELDHPVMMRFYPSFEEDKIYEMPVTFSYESWAPWNKDYKSDVLFPKVVDMISRWYNVEMKVLDHKTMGKVYYAMDKYRRINVFIRDDQAVEAVLTDMRIETQIKERNKKQEEGGV